METGYQSDAIEITKNFQEVFSVLPENINSNSVFYVGNSNMYTVVNNNLVVCIDIRLRRVGGAGQIGGNGVESTVLKLPVPAQVDGVISWTAQSTEGNPFFCRISSYGLLVIEGFLSSDLDEVVINFPSYMAKYPLEIPKTPIFNTTP